MPRPLYPRERPGTHCMGGWVDPRAGLDGCGKSRPPPPTAIRSPNCPESLYRLSYPGPSIKGKRGKVRPRTSHEGSDGEWGYSSTLSLTSALDGVGGQRQSLAALPSGKRPSTDCTGGWVGLRACLDG